MLSIRQFRPDDAEAVRDLFSHAQDDFAESYLHNEADREGFHEYIDGALNHDLAHVERSYLQRPGSNFWVAELDGSVGRLHRRVPAETMRKRRYGGWRWTERRRRQGDRVKAAGRGGSVLP